MTIYFSPNLSRDFFPSVHVAAQYHILTSTHTLTERQLQESGLKIQQPTSMPKTNYTSAGTAKPNPDLVLKSLRFTLAPAFSHSNHKRCPHRTKLQITISPSSSAIQYRSPNQPVGRDQPRVRYHDRHGYEIFGMDGAGTLRITWPAAILRSRERAGETPRGMATDSCNVVWRCGSIW